MATFNGRIALITGASRGLGRAAALALGREGAHVILVARSIGQLEDLDDEIRASGGSATLLKLDLRKGDQIDLVGPNLFQRWGRLDILIGAAATLGTLSPLSHVTTDAWAQVLDVNLTANWRLIRTLDPLLRLSTAGRAAFLTCAEARPDTAYWGPYAASKAALEALVRSYALEHAETAVRVNLIEPGPMRTGLRAKAYPGEPETLLPRPEDAAVPRLLQLVSPACLANGLVHRLGHGSNGTTGPSPT